MSIRLALPGRQRMSTTGDSAAGTSPVPNSRLNKWKNLAPDVSEMRRQREEDGLQLRKQKRDEQVNIAKLSHFCRISAIFISLIIIIIMFGQFLKRRYMTRCYLKGALQYSTL